MRITFILILAMLIGCTSTPSWTKFNIGQKVIFTREIVAANIDKGDVGTIIGYWQFYNTQSGLGYRIVLDKDRSRFITNRLELFEIVDDKR